MSAILKQPLLQIRPMRQADVEAVLAAEEAAYSHPWTRGIFLDCLRVGYCCWVCEVDGEVVGHSIMSVAVGEAHLLNLCIHPDWQNRGLGRSMLGRVLRLASEHHADTIFLEVRAGNEAAQGLYRSLGFNEIGVRKAYYPARKGREDAVLFAKAIA